MKCREYIIQLGGPVLKVLLIVLPLISLMVCKYSNCIGLWLPYTVLASVLSAIVCIQLFLQRDYSVNIADILLCLYGLYVIIRIWCAKESYIEPLSVLKWMLFALLYISGRLSDKNVIPLVLIAIGVYGVLSYLLSFFSNPGHLGAYISVGLSGTIGLITEKDRNPSEKIFLLGLGIVLLVILFLSKSRGALLALVIVSVYLFIRSNKNKHLNLNKKLLLFLLLSGVVSVVVFFLYKLRTGSADVRMLIWLSSGAAFLKAPIWGYSSGAVQSLYMLWQAEYFQMNPCSFFVPFATNHYQTFNEYIHILCEQGLAGFIIFTLFVLYVFRKCTSVGLIAASLSLGVSSFFLYTYDIFPIIILVPLFLGFANRCDIISGYSNGEDKKIRLHIRFIICAVVLSISFFICGEVGRKYSLAEKELKEFISLTEDSVSNRLHPLKESVIFRNKDMALLYATHSYLLSPEDRISVLEQCSKKIFVVEMMSILGNLYLNSSLNDKAERCFILAHYMAPDRIGPKYDLFKLYCDNDNKEKTKEWADKILLSSPRIYNAVTVEIKAKVRAFINSEQRK